ncbi:MAG: nuclear transport factor 2 family protein [Longimicrobiales bacterium]
MRAMFRSVLAATVLIAATGAGSQVRAQAAPASAAEGERLERQMWAYLKANDQANLMKRMAPYFQSAHSDGTRDRAGELALIKTLKPSDYTLSRFKVSTAADIMVVSYWISVRETIAGKTTSSKPAMRQSVWRKNAAGWQWIAHSNLVPIS